jgi:hypothetical protein
MGFNWAFKVLNTMKCDKSFSTKFSGLRWEWKGKGGGGRRAQKFRDKFTFSCQCPILLHITQNFDVSS